MPEPTALETHAGTETEIDNSGTFTIDTTEADTGDITLRLKDGAKLTVEVGGTAALEVYSEGGSARIDLGSGADERLVLGDALMQLLNEFFQQKYDLHTHPTSVGPSGPPLPLFTGAQMTDAHLSDLAKTKKS